MKNYHYSIIGVVLFYVGLILGFVTTNWTFMIIGLILMISGVGLHVLLNNLEKTEAKENDIRSYSDDSNNDKHICRKLVTISKSIFAYGILSSLSVLFLSFVLGDLYILYGFISSIINFLFFWVVSILISAYEIIVRNANEMIQERNN